MNQFKDNGNEVIDNIERAAGYVLLGERDEALDCIYKAEAALKALRHYIFHMKFRSGEKG